MAKKKTDGKDHDATREKVDSIRALLEPFCLERLNAEYAEVCLKMLGTLGRKRPSPLLKGDAAAWAAGIVRAVGSANFLGDKAQKPHASTAQIDDAFGVSQATGAARSKAIRDLLKISPFSVEWSLPGKVADHPLVELASILQAINLPAPPRKKAVTRNYVRVAVEPTGPTKLFTVEVFVISGPMTKAFSKANKVIARTIQIRGDQSLADLHEAIFDALDRSDAHMYEFQFGKGPNDPDGDRYGLPSAFQTPDSDLTGNVATTMIGSLGLKKKQAFGYWFDFGDDWWHQINVIAIDDHIPAGKYPKVIAAEGASPPQYANFEADK